MWTSQICQVLSFMQSKLIDCPSHLYLLTYPPGDFAGGHPANSWSQHECGTASLFDLSYNPWVFNARRGVPWLQTERCCRRKKCWCALEGQTVSWSQGGGCRISTKPLPFLSLAHCSSTLASCRAKLLAPHGQRFQCLYVAEGGKAGGEGWGQRQGWEKNNPSSRLWYAWSSKHELVLRFYFLCFPEESNPPGAEVHHGSSQAGARLVEEGLIHILSMGSKALMLQVWADFTTGSLTFRWAPA